MKVDDRASERDAGLLDARDFGLQVVDSEADPVAAKPRKSWIEAVSRPAIRGLSVYCDFAVGDETSPSSR